MLRFVLAMVLLAATPAHAATPTCRTLEGAPRIDAGDRVVEWAAPIVDAVVAAEERLDPTRARPRIAFVALGSTTGAWFCADRDAVFVAQGLLEYAELGRASDGADFLAFVVSHELAHRRFDGDPRATSAKGFGGAEAGGLAREVAADERGTFLVALARDPRSGRGFSPWRLERNATLEHFLVDEVGVAPGSVEGVRRVEALRAALARMSELAEVYSVALALAFAPLEAAGDGVGVGPRDQAGALLAHLDAALNPATGWARVPELSVIRALLHVRRAAQARGVDCPVSYGGQPALSPFDALGARGAAAVDVGRELAAARRALDDARTRRLPAALVGPVARCLERVAAAPAHATSANLVLGAPGGGAVDDLAIERLALAAETACDKDSGSGRVIALADATLWAGGGAGNRCYRAGLGANAAVALLEALEPEAMDLETWSGACDVFGHGVGDDGTEAFGAYCSGVDAGRMRAWTLFARDGQVERVVRIVGH